MRPEDRLHVIVHQPIGGSVFFFTPEDPVHGVQGLGWPAETIYRVPGTNYAFGKCARVIVYWDQVSK